MTTKKIDFILQEASEGKAISKEDAVYLLSLNENSMEASLLRSRANEISRRRFGNNGLLLGQIGVDMAPCSGNCSFCFFAESHTSIQPAKLSLEEIINRCNRFAIGGAQGVFLMTMHQFGFEWFRDLCFNIRKAIPAHMELLANVGDLEIEQMKELKAAGISGAYHVCRIKEGEDSCMSPEKRMKTIENILESGLDWYNMCEPVGPEHTPQELVDQIWIGVDIPCTQHGVMQRFPVAGSPLYHYGEVSLPRLGQIVAVVVLATLNNKETKSIAVNVSNLVGLFSGANAFFPEAGEPTMIETINNKEGFTTATWRNSNEITTLDCRRMFLLAGFSGLMNTKGHYCMPISEHVEEELNIISK
ncbi:MAG TPA: radical SAM protein [Bacteroidales bacterium]|nr:radical SAM protein [Bacteroidales bacterium]HOU95675.1 radical SAM protein [Bacteroidales bacterium]HQG53194.1 radical SAM protein [Bacteroidales bacterium]HQJ20316.1 radical SAM protein [Bacteroidales bacterium]